ncbi:MAG: type VI secretion system baseplate subunit TssG [Gemmatimonadaceae bacterium]|jgi:type VI secretion system protein ImpH|nr:type VI secretion system baseplate subunit TssG [Gemmatimonadaceae bacterium]
MEAARVSAVTTVEVVTGATSVARSSPLPDTPLPDLSDAEDFDVVPLALLLERLHPERARVGEGTSPMDEVARLRIPPSITFPPGEVRAVSRDDVRAPYEVQVHLPGLTGPMATLPWHYSEEVRDRSAEGDDALRDFLDLLHHRTLSLFVRAAARARPTGSTADLLGRTVCALLGAPDARARQGLPIPAESVLSYAALFVPQVRSAVGLEQCLADYFDVPVTVRQFTGAHYLLADADRTAIDGDDALTLGAGTLVGDCVFDPSAKVTIDVGPVDFATYRRFLPGGDAADALAGLVRAYVDDSVEADVHLVLARESVPGAVLEPDDETVQLGWTTWVTTRARTMDAVEVTLPLGAATRVASEGAGSTLSHV